MCGLTELLTGLEKKYDWKYEMSQKDKRRNTDGPKRKGKKEIKHGRIFGLLRIGNLIEMIFDLKKSLELMQVRSYFIHLIIKG
jgi:hypothetical protein